MKKRKVSSGEIHHVYQRTVNGAVVFYDLADYLVFFTIFCAIADRMEVSVLALCPMPDHLHNACRAKSATQLSSFVQQYTHLFATEWNLSRGQKGSLFKARFGSAAKLGNKSIRSTLNYNNNNPVERKMVSRAEEYRWNFLSYARQPAPYSQPLLEMQASFPMKQALQALRRCHQEGRWINYRQWDYWTRKLDSVQIQQLADFVIGTWNVIDYAQAVSYYGDHQAMLRSFHDNTGSEYEITEDKDKYSDAVYEDCTRILLNKRYIRSVREIPGLPIKTKASLLELLSKRTSATQRQLRKYLHWYSNPTS